MKKYYQINHRIRAQKLRVITKDGENLGVLSTREALKQAQDQDLDLVLIAENTDPPVAKILDFNKFLYEERKKEAQTRARSKKSELKEFRFGPSIGEADLTNRIKRAEEFIKKGDRVRVTIQLRGRERAYPEIGLEKIKRFERDLEHLAKLEDKPKVLGNRITSVFVKK